MDDRGYWVQVLERIARPVLEALAARRLRATMPVEQRDLADGREQYSHFEAFARTLCGIAPWLELGDDGTPEGATRAAYAQLARTALAAATDPASADYLNFSDGLQPVVEIGFFAEALLRAPTALWADLDATTRANIITAISATRTRKPVYNNWLLFSATAEAALYQLGAQPDLMRVDYAIRQHDQWYKGGGVYGDGPEFHWDYYNSFVIQPMLLDTLRAFADLPDWQAFYAPMVERARQYGAALERLISPEGTIPPLGRSLAYRFGALHSLGQLALLDLLPEGISAGQTRAAMTAVIRRMVEAPATFDQHGWLTIGFYGHQPHVGEHYISTGSLYLCATALLPLGLPATNPFWSAPPEPWTAQKMWGLA